MSPLIKQLIVLKKNALQAALEKKLGKSRSALAKRVIEIMRRDCNVLAELSGVPLEDLTKSQAAAQPSASASLREQMFQGMSEKIGATTTFVARASKRSPRGVLQLMETFETRQALLFVAERTICSVGNATRSEGCSELKSMNRDWHSVEMTTAEVARGISSLCDALAATHGGSAGLAKRRLHLGLSPESIFVSRAGDWRLGGYGFALTLAEGAAVDTVPCQYFDDAPTQQSSSTKYGSGGADEAGLVTGSPRLMYCAPELTQSAASGGGLANRGSDVFSLAAVVYELMGNRGALLGENVGDSTYRHQSAVATRLAYEADLNHLPPLLRDALGRALNPNPSARPEVSTMRGSPGLYTPAVRALQELDKLAMPGIAVGLEPAHLVSFLTSLPMMLAPDAPEAADAFTTRALRVCVAPALDEALRSVAKPEQRAALEAIRSHAGPIVFACASRLDARDFRAFMQPLIDKLIQSNNATALRYLVEDAQLVLDKADAAWAAVHVTEAFCRALADKADQATHEVALRRLGESETLDALLAKASLADHKHRAAAATQLVPAICRLAVVPAAASLGLRVQALKTLGAVIDRPSATPPETLDKVVAPALGKLVANLDGKPALAMCALGCFDALARRLTPDALACKLLPALAPMLVEKALNAKQFDMVVARVEKVLNSVVTARRAELGCSPPPRTEMSTTPSDVALPLRPQSTTATASYSMQQPPPPPPVVQTPPLVDPPKPKIALGLKRTPPASRTAQVATANRRHGAESPKVAAHKAAALKVAPPQNSGDPFSSILSSRPPAQSSSDPFPTMLQPQSMPQADPFASSSFDFISASQPAESALGDSDPFAVISLPLQSSSMSMSFETKEAAAASSGSSGASAFDFLN